MTNWYVYTLFFAEQILIGPSHAEAQSIYSQDVILYIQQCDATLLHKCMY